MSENNNNKDKDILIAKLEATMQSILDTVQSIKASLDSQITRLSTLDKQVTILEQKDIQQQKEIDELKSNNKQLKQWLIGIAGTVAGGIVLAIVKVGIGM